MAKVAFIGAGIMGREMALRLVGAGHEVRVYNRTRAKLAALVEAGAAAAASPREAASGAEFIVSMVGDDGASREVWLGAAGVLGGRPEAAAVAIESSTLSRGWVLELDKAARAAGLRFIDCPVTGGPDGARAGALTLLAGGDEATLREAGPVLAAYGKEVVRFGPTGAGTSYKLIVNLMGAVQATALAEGLLLAERAGLDLEKVGEMLRKGAVASPLVAYLSERMVSGAHDDVYFSARWRHKDATYGLELARELGQAMPTSAVAEELFRLALARGLADKNSSVVIEALR